MTSLDDGGRWCPQCGAEYRPEFTECSDCLVSLTNVAPEVAASEDHAQVEYDLAQWSEPQRAALSVLLVGRDVAHQWTETHLVVPHVAEAVVDQLIDELDENPPSPLEPADD